MREAGDLAVDELLGVARLRVDVDDGWMTLAEAGGQLGLVPEDLGLLRAQSRNRRRLHGFGDGARVQLALAQLLDLLEPRLGLVRLRARERELIGELGELLFADELPARADDIVLRLVGLAAILGLAHAVLELGQPAGQCVGCAPRGGGAGAGLILEIGLHDRVCDHRGLFGAARRHREVDHVGALLAACDDEGAQRLQRDDGRLGLRHRRRHAELAIDEIARQVERRGRLDEFRVLVEAVREDDASQHVVRGQHAHLAFHVGGVRVGRRAVGGDRVVDDAQVVRIDQELGDGGIARRDRREEQHGGDQAGERSDRDPGPAPPQYAKEFAGRRGLLALACDDLRPFG